MAGPLKTEDALLNMELKKYICGNTHSYQTLQWKLISSHACIVMVFFILLLNVTTKRHGVDLVICVAGGLHHTIASGGIHRDFFLKNICQNLAHEIT